MNADKPKATRSVEMKIEIEAPPDEVWKALTEADELTRWFPLNAETTPGEGGKILLDWGEGLGGTNKISVWKPNQHLQTTFMEPAETMMEEIGGTKAELLASEEAKAMVMDYHLEGAGGRTVLRLVHSGISADDRWDDEYDGYRRGWAFQLRSLRTYLERHKGRNRAATWIRQPVSCSFQEAWDRLVGPEGLLAEGSLDSPSEGDRYSVTTVHGDRLQGTVQCYDPPGQFSGTIENRKDSLLLVATENCGGPQASVWISSWRHSQEEVDAWGEKWRKTLAGLFAA